LPDTTQRQLNLEAFQREYDRTLALADEIKVTRSGGKKRGPVVVASRRRKSEPQPYALKT